MRLKFFAWAAALLIASPTTAQTVFDTTLGETGQTTREVSTAELQRLLKDGTTVVLDARPPMEFAVSHIPGALNVAPKAGVAKHLYVSDVAEVDRLVGGAKDKPLALYCNGPFCGKTKRLGAELLAAGHTSVRRYQLGAPSWRALSRTAMQTELPALPYIAKDKTAVWVDARAPSEFAKGGVRGAKNIPAQQLSPRKDQGVMQAAKDDGRLPMDDHNTRIIVFGASSDDAKAVANAIASEAFHNVSFVAAPIAEVIRALR